MSKGIDEMHAQLDCHLQFLRETEKWFAQMRALFADRMQCGRCCALCCRGLFDISFADALILAHGLGRLEAVHRQQVKEQAAAVQAIVGEAAPGLRSPFFLNEVPEAGVDAIVAAAQSPRCALLSDHDECLVYQHRPLACRLEGVPMVDVGDGLFGDWCGLNFKQGTKPEDLVVLVRDYYGIQAQEDAATEALTELLLGTRNRHITVFIPSVITEHETFWRELLNRLSGPHV